MAEIKSILKPENSAIAGIAVVGLVWGNYAVHNGSAAQTSMTPQSNHTTTTNKKAGWTSLIMVAGISLITRDANIFILGCGAIIVLHSSFIHSINADASTGKLPPAGAVPAAAAYAPSGS